MLRLYLTLVLVVFYLNILLLVSNSHKYGCIYLGKRTRVHIVVGYFAFLPHLVIAKMRMSDDIVVCFVVL